jgi:polyhydroxybutyrate depolymerase
MPKANHVTTVFRKKEGLVCRALLLSGVAVLSFQLGLEAKCKKYDFMFGGRKRTYWMHRPEAASANRKLPLVIVLHGGGATAKRVLAISDMCRKADKESFVVLAPNGTSIKGLPFYTWNAGNCCGYAQKHQVNDVGFIAALIDKLEAQGNIDPARVYVTGASNGGMMAYRLGCELSARIAAIAPVAACMDGHESYPDYPVSVMAFNGTADRTIRYDGGMGIAYISRFKVFSKPASYAANFWVRHNGCAESPQLSNFGNISLAKFSGGRQGAEVVLCTIKGGSHCWPGGGRNWLWARQPSREISATDEMWRFFLRHHKPELVTAAETVKENQ